MSIASMFYPVPVTQKYNKPVREQDTDLLACTKCGCQWLELLEVQQWSKYNTVVLGQKPSPKMGTGFYIFKCPKCNDIYEPPINVTPNEMEKSNYGNFISQLETPYVEPVKKAENPEAKVEKI